MAMGVQVRCGCTANAGHNYKGVAFNTHAVQRLRHVLLPARAPKEPVHRLRHGLLPARAPEEPVHRLRHAARAGCCQHGRRKDRCKDCGTGARYRR